jgi:hypothetical protein
MPQLEELIPRILDRTLEDKLTWEPLTNDSVIARIEDASLELYAGTSRGGGVRLTLRDDQGRVLESLSWEELPSPADGQLTELWQVARRKALQIDKVLSKLRDKLDRL